MCVRVRTQADVLRVQQRLIDRDRAPQQLLTGAILSAGIGLLCPYEEK